MAYVIGVDIGGTSVKIAVISKDGDMICFDHIQTRRENNGEYILQDVCKKIRTMISLQNISHENILGIGVGVPGPIVDGRTVSRCVNLGWGAKDVASFFEQELGWNCRIGNDANVAALGEAWKGAAQNTHSSVMVTIGTGIGSGIIVDGKIITGFLGGGGEIGHMPIEDAIEETVCACGNENCLEIFTSATGIVTAFYRLTGRALSAKEILNAAKGGQKIAIEVVDKMQNIMGKACAVIGCVVNPEIFVIGGGVSKAGDFLLSGIEKYYNEYIFQPIKGTKFALATLGNDAGVYGAAKLVLG